MATPKTRIPKPLRRDVELAFECWRDYLLAIDNQAAAMTVNDVLEVLGLERLPEPDHASRYHHPQLATLLRNRRSYGER